jgi:Tfp pilus assembly protein PilN
MSTLTSVRGGTTARVNLLPPEIIEEARFRKVRSGLVVAVVASVAVVGWLFVAASSDASDAQGELDAATARQAVLKTRAAQYAEVPQVNAELEAAHAQLATAMGQEVRWSFLLNDLSLRTPSQVWLKTLHAEVVTASAKAEEPDGIVPTGVGVLQVTGTGYRHNDVASWLEVLAKTEGFVSPYFTSSTDVEIGDRTAVDFDSTAVMTPERLSGRYTIDSQEAGR